MTDGDRILIYAAYRISPDLGHALEDVLRAEKATREQRDRLYILLTEQVGNPRIPKDVYMGLLDALRHAEGK